METRKREGQQLLLRFTEGSDLREKLEECAKANNRSLTGEILHRLEHSIIGQAVKEVVSEDDFVKYKEFIRLREQVRAIQETLDRLSK